jgi:DNA-binding MarR family transcriptional regulator
MAERRAAETKTRNGLPDGLKLRSKDLAKNLAGVSLVKLENQLCFAIYAASRAITNAYRPLLSGLELTYPQYIVMLALWEQDDVTIGSLGQRLFLDFGTLTPLLKRLEKRGLLSRIRDREDERQVKVILTAAGRRMQREAAGVPGQLRCQISLSRQDTAFLREAMKALTNDLVQ